MIPLEEEMATCSSILAWEIPWTEESGGLQSTGSWTVGHNLATKQQQPPAWILYFLVLESLEVLQHFSWVLTLSAFGYKESGVSTGDGINGVGAGGGCCHQTESQGTLRAVARAPFPQGTPTL